MKKKIKDIAITVATLASVISIWPLRVPQYIYSHIKPPIETRLAEDVLKSTKGWTSIDSALDVNGVSEKQYQDYLGYTDVLVRTYQRADGSDKFTIYLGYWAPGSQSIQSVGGHTPSACLPGIGGTVKIIEPEKKLSPSPLFNSVEHSYCRFRDSARPDMEVLFEHFVNGKPYATTEPQLFRGHRKIEILFNYGLTQHRTQQYALRIMTHGYFNTLKDDEGFKEILTSIEARIKKN